MTIYRAALAILLFSSVISYAQHDEQLTVKAEDEFIVPPKNYQADQWLTGKFAFRLQLSSASEKDHCSGSFVSCDNAIQFTTAEHCLKGGSLSDFACTGSYVALSAGKDLKLEITSGQDYSEIKCLGEFCSIVLNEDSAILQKLPKEQILPCKKDFSSALAGTVIQLGYPKFKEGYSERPNKYMLDAKNIRVLKDAGIAYSCSASECIPPAQKILGLDSSVQMGTRCHFCNLGGISGGPTLFKDASGAFSLIGVAYAHNYADIPEALKLRKDGEVVSILGTGPINFAPLNQIDKKWRTQNCPAQP